MKHHYNLKIEHIPASNLVFKELPDHIKLKLKQQKLMRKKAKKARKGKQGNKGKNQKNQKIFPSVIDLRSNPNMPPVFDQLDIGSCTAQALCAAYTYESPAVVGSRLFLYYNERLRDLQNGDNAVTIDDGSSLTNGIKCLQIYGLCPEIEWPHDTKKFAIKPPDSCYTNALKNKALEVYNVRNRMIDMKNSLVLNTPFSVGIAIYPSFESLRVSKTGVVPMPGPRERPLGGHAVLVCGYNDVKKQWILRNSWGPSWGDKGYFYLPYAYLLNPRLSSDFWAIKTVS
jgi:C1A family cysteine protease